MASLQELTDAWGNWYSAQNGTSMRFTSSTSYSDHGELGQYVGYQVNASVPKVTYGANTNPQIDTSYTNTQIATNNTAINQSYTFQSSRAVTDTNTWTTAAAVSVGLTLSTKVGLPAVAEETATASFNLTVTNTSGGSTTDNHTVTATQTVTQAPFTITTAKQVVNFQTLNVPYTTEVDLNGYVAIWNNDKVNGHWLWFIPITEVLTDVINNRLIDTSGFSFSNNGGIAVTSTGLFTQQAASTSYFDISAKPISPTSSLTAVKPITLKNKGISPTTLDNETQSHTLIGGLGNDYIRGYAAGTNDIRGNEGNDTLISGSNGDVLSGGLGADIFKFIDLAHKSTSITSGEDIDTILDFSNTDHDKIDLSKIDANSKIRGNQEFKFIGTNNFSKSPIGQLRFDVQTHSLYGHTNTDKIPDFVIHLSGINSLSTEDIVL